MARENRARQGRTWQGETGPLRLCVSQSDTSNASEGASGRTWAAVWVSSHHHREPKTERSEAKPRTGTPSESVRSSPASERSKCDYANKGSATSPTGGGPQDPRSTPRVGLRHARSDDVYVRRPRFAEDKPAASIAAAEERRAPRPGRVALPDSEPRSSSSGNSGTKPHRCLRSHNRRSIVLSITRQNISHTRVSFRGG